LLLKKTALARRYTLHCHSRKQLLLWDTHSIVTQENSSCCGIHTPLLLKKTALVGRDTLYCYSRKQLLLGETLSIATQENCSLWEIHSPLLLKKTALAGMCGFMSYCTLFTIRIHTILFYAVLTAAVSDLALLNLRNQGITANLDDLTYRS
jgi:hypothetical protein